MWDLPGPGLEPVSPALGGGFLTTAPPGKPLNCIFTVPLHVLSLLLPVFVMGREKIWMVNDVIMKHNCIMLIETI